MEYSLVLLIPALGAHMPSAQKPEQQSVGRAHIELMPRHCAHLPWLQKREQQSAGRLQTTSFSRQHILVVELQIPALQQAGPVAPGVQVTPTPSAQGGALQLPSVQKPEQQSVERLQAPLRPRQHVLVVELQAPALQQAGAAAPGVQLIPRSREQVGGGGVHVQSTEVQVSLSSISLQLNVPMHAQSSPKQLLVHPGGALALHLE